MSKATHDITQLLFQHREGDSEALNRLMPLVYEQLRDIAKLQMRRQRSDHTLSPTALVHEAFVRMQKSQGIELNDRKHFYLAASRCMKWLLVDYARAKNSAKRGETPVRIIFDEKLHSVESRGIDVAALVESLERLAQQDERLGKVIELRFLAGLTLEEIATVMELSLATVKRDLAMAKMWLRRDMGTSEEGAK